MIRVENLVRRYGAIAAVDNVSFRIGSGQVVGLLGHNGSGKTTIMKMLTGFLEPTSGQVEIDGMEIGVQPRAIQSLIGYLPENCPICDRPLIAGASVDRHHWVPRAFGGRSWDWMHQVCHRKIHALFGEAELAHAYPDAERIRAHPEMAKFVAWVKRRPPEFNDWHKSPRRRR